MSSDAGLYSVHCLLTKIQSFKIIFLEFNFDSIENVRFHNKFFFSWHIPGLNPIYSACPFPQDGSLGARVRPIFDISNRRFFSGSCDFPILGKYDPLDTDKK